MIHNGTRYIMELIPPHSTNSSILHSPIGVYAMEWSFIVSILPFYPYFILSLFFPHPSKYFFFPKSRVFLRVPICMLAFLFLCSGYVHAVDMFAFHYIRVLICTCSGYFCLFFVLPTQCVWIIFLLRRQGRAIPMRCHVSLWCSHVGEVSAIPMGFCLEWSMSFCVGRWIVELDKISNNMFYIIIVVLKRLKME